ncbi:MAG: M23 family metallopeptidase [bacterium]|nr:M23 family metallopeptidase [bacterium]
MSLRFNRLAFPALLCVLVSGCAREGGLAPFEIRHGMAPQRASIMNATATPDSSVEQKSFESSETPPASGGDFMIRRPVQGPVVLKFNIEGVPRNEGINIEAPQGTVVHAAAEGEVAYVGNALRDFGNLVLVRHKDGWMTAYAHLEEVSVEDGQALVLGSVIGKVGSSGTVESAQLHFELRQGANSVDPSPHFMS